MAEILDLSTIKDDGYQKGAESYDDLSDAAKAKIDEIAEQHVNDAPAFTHRVATAYLVTIGYDGQVKVDTDVDALYVDRKRLPTPDDLTSSTSIIQRDIESQLTSQTILMGMQQVAMQQMNLMQNQQIAAGLNLSR